ncbi:hypothetical protein Vi05172_g912 [Venturia inaequalis]|nr:hypothetical protein Vi05172_g912 [Venturia inaequalis]
MGSLGSSGLDSDGHNPEISQKDMNERPSEERRHSSSPLTDISSGFEPKSSSNSQATATNLTSMSHEKPMLQKQDHACIQCRIAKTACDQGIPSCGRCASVGKAAQCVYRGERKTIEGHEQANDQAQPYADAGHTGFQSQNEDTRSPSNPAITPQYFKRSVLPSSPQPGSRTFYSSYNRPASATPCSGTNAAQRISSRDADTNVKTLRGFHPIGRPYIEPSLNFNASIGNLTADAREVHEIPIPEKFRRIAEEDKKAWEATMRRETELEEEERDLAEKLREEYESERKREEEALVQKFLESERLRRLKDAEVKERERKVIAMREELLRLRQKRREATAESAADRGQ